ncbi:MAG: hypothetical protein ACREA4_11645 [Nitrososphaera sp.]
MGWLNFSFIGAAALQADDLETSTIIETGDKSMALPTAIKIVDVVADRTATSQHQRRFYVNGKAQGSQFFQAQINPNTQGRLNWANQNIIIPKGATIQMRGAQKDALGIEATKVLVQYQEV